MMDQATGKTPGASGTPAVSGRVCPAPFWGPYAAGAALGLALLLAFYVTGHGLGASGGFTRIVAAAEHAACPGCVAQNAYWRGYLGTRPILLDRLVFEIAGVLLGGTLGAVSAGRFRIGIERGPRIGASQRMALAFLGGVIVAFAGRLARGCTSGQALTGGATLAVGSWAFMFAVFAGGYAAAWFFRRQWT